MSAMSNYLENKLIDHLFRGVPYVAPTVLEFALLTSAPTDSGGGVEVSGGDYERVAVAASTTSFAATNAPASVNATSSGSSGTTSNNTAITYPQPSALWGVVTCVGVYDSHVGGNLLWWNPLANPKTINAGDDPPSFQPAMFSVQMDT